MSSEEFFGYGSCDSGYDSRRHINVIFVELMSYKLYVNQSLTMQCIQYALSLSEQQAAEYICNDVLTYAEHNYLSLLRERYGLSSKDFSVIMSGRTLVCKVSKTPAGYSREDNLRLLVQMCIARMYMTPQSQSAFVNINSMIVQVAKGMRGICLSQKFISELFSLTNDAMGKYKDNYHLKEIENYVISKIWV